ncbi:MAG: PssE/Cps14G family polysaccharide biosynthesis glycosyltransferase [Anaerolineae bacterium]
MVFVTVGTTEFDALVQAMDAWAADHDEPVVMQIGHGTYIPRHAEHFRFAPTLVPYYERADLVVAHGGLGTTMEVLHLRKRLVSVSNPDRYDRHQEDLLEALDAAGHLLWCRDLRGLPEAIAEARRREFVPYTPPPCRIHEVIAAYLQEQFGPG